MTHSCSHMISLGKLRVGTKGKFLAVCKADESEERIEGYVPDLPLGAPLLNGQADRLFEQYCRELEHHGITYVWHTLAQGSRSVQMISNKDWGHRYVEGDCAKIDVLDQAVFCRSQNIFFWRDLFEICTPEQQNLIQERDFDYGLRNGVTISLDHRTLKEGRFETSHSESITFATDSKTFDLPDFCLANYPLIHSYLETMTLLSSQILESTDSKTA